METLKSLVSALFHNPIAKIWSLVPAPFPVLAPDSKDISSDELIKILRKKFGEKVHLHIDDNRYTLVDKERLDKCFRFDGTKHMSYRKEVNDCDNYAAIARAKVLHWGYLCGLKWNPAFGQFSAKGVKEGSKDMGHHSLCIIVDNKKKVMLYEPQNGNWYKPVYKSIDFIHM